MALRSFLFLRLFEHLRAGAEHWLDTHFSDIFLMRFKHYYNVSPDFCSFKRFSERKATRLVTCWLCEKVCILWVWLLFRWNVTMAWFGDDSSCYSKSHIDLSTRGAVRVWPLSQRQPCRRRDCIQPGSAFLQARYVACYLKFFWTFGRKRRQMSGHRLIIVIRQGTGEHSDFNHVGWSLLGSANCN